MKKKQEYSQIFVSHCANKNDVIQANSTKFEKVCLRSETFWVMFVSKNKTFHLWVDQKEKTKK